MRNGTGMALTESCYRCSAYRPTLGRSMVCNTTQRRWLPLVGSRCCLACARKCRNKKTKHRMLPGDTNIGVPSCCMTPGGAARIVRIETNDIQCPSKRSQKLRFGEVWPIIIPKHTSPSSAIPKYQHEIANTKDTTNANPTSQQTYEFANIVRAYMARRPVIEQKTHGAPCRTHDSTYRRCACRTTTKPSP